MMTSEKLILIPRTRPEETAVEIAQWIPFIMRMNNKGERGSPYLKPRLMKNLEVGPKPIKTSFNPQSPFRTKSKVVKDEV